MPKVYEVDCYVVSAQQLSEAASWRILDACNEHAAQAVDAATYDAPELSLDGLKKNMCEPSSSPGPA
ncbi:hypothetical protein DFH06DRAFT_1331427 [Mycena polygramma]|nr:hypothetical protein DFH06DRAFT_1331427 [Mycena polygramma]